MTDNDDILGPLTRTLVPDLDPDRRDRIESALRVQHAAGRKGPSRAGLPRWLVAAPALVLLLVVSTVVLLAGDEAAVAALEVRDAHDVVITLASGETIENPEDGFALTDGSVVVVGDSGTITIDDVTLSAGAVVTVRDGNLVTDVVATTTTNQPDRTVPSSDQIDDIPDDGSVPTTTVPDTRPIDPAPSETRPQVTLPPSGPPTGPVDPPIDREPPPDRLFEPTDDDAPDDPETRPVEDGEPEAEAPGTDIAVALSVAARDGRIRVTWNTDGVDAASWRVLLLRTIDGSVPEASASAEIVGEGAQGEVSERRADMGDRVVELRYRVVILDEVGGVVARSEIQTLNPADS